MAALIEMRGVSFSAQNQRVIGELSCGFEEGKSTALAGPSGCGKSTLLKLSAGLLLPSRGEVSYRGRDIVRMSRGENLAFRREGAVVFQDSALWANQSLRQTLELPLRLHFPGMNQEERDLRLREVLGEVGYRRDLDIRPSMLSMGEQKLIAFARALICRPALLFLDEWTESLDESAARRLIGLAQKRREQGHTILFVSHDFRIIRDLADQVLLIQEGRIHLQLSREQMESDEGLARLVERGIAS
jgi:ABC-type multidrug transport system ATPase subunit